MILYLAGPMSSLPASNYPEFLRVAALLRNAGHTVLNPAENPEPPCGSYEGWLRMSFRQVTHAEAVALLDGWEASVGANREIYIAEWLSLEVRHWEAWL